MEKKHPHPPMLQNWLKQVSRLGLRFAVSVFWKVMSVGMNCIHAHKCECMWVRDTHVCAYTHTWVCTHTCMCIHTHTRMYAYKYVRNPHTCKCERVAVLPFFFSLFCADFVAIVQNVIACNTRIHTFQYTHTYSPTQSATRA